MKLTKEQMEVYEEEGMLFIPKCFCKMEVETMNAALLPLMKEDAPGLVLENNKKKQCVRSTVVIPPAKFSTA